MFLKLSPSKPHKHYSEIHPKTVPKIEISIQPNLFKMHENKKRKEERESEAYLRWHVRLVRKRERDGRGRESGERVWRERELFGLGREERGQRRREEAAVFKIFPPKRRRFGHQMRQPIHARTTSRSPEADPPRTRTTGLPCGRSQLERQVVFSQNERLAVCSPTEQQSIQDTGRHVVCLICWTTCSSALFLDFLFFIFKQFFT